MNASADSTVWRRLFADHPAAVRESYPQHFLAACRMGIRLLGMALACICHAVIPGVFEATASRGVKKLASEMARRRCCHFDGAEL